MIRNSLLQVLADTLRDYFQVNIEKLGDKQIKNSKRLFEIVNFLNGAGLIVGKWDIDYKSIVHLRLDDVNQDRRCWAVIPEILEEEKTS